MDARHRTPGAGRTGPRRLAFLAVVVASLLSPPAGAITPLSTSNLARYEQPPPAPWNDSGWTYGVHLWNYMGTVIFSNAVLTAHHLYFGTGLTFTYEGVTRTVTNWQADASHDLMVGIFRPPATNWARLNIETNEVGRWIVLQGRGHDPEQLVTTGGRTNGWTYTENYSAPGGPRRWGVNRIEGYDHAPAYGLGWLAWAAFDRDGDPDEGMLVHRDSGGPGFIRSGTGWRLMGVNSTAGPLRFSRSADGASPFYAALFDYAGLYANDGAGWVYADPSESPLPATLYLTRTAPLIGWITNRVRGIAFEADVGLHWEAGSPPTAPVLWVTNRGPYAVRNLAIDVGWPAGVAVRDVHPTVGSYADGTARWTLPVLSDGAGAALPARTASLRLNPFAATNTAAVAARDKPDPVASNDTASLCVHLPPAATLLQLL